MKIIKKSLIIILVAILAIFLLLLAAPILLKEKLLEISKKKINGMLVAEADFSDLKLSFIHNFPDAYIALEDLTILGTGEFAGETPVEFKTFSVRVDIMSVIRMSNIRVKSILLDQPQINARISEKGNANWNIMKPKEKEPPPPPPDKTTPDKAASPLKIALNKFEIRNANISFRDDARKMTAEANDLNFFLQGDMSMDNADLNMKLDIAGVNFMMNGITMLSRAQVGLVSQVAADIKNMAFTLKENRFNLNEIVLKFAGSARIRDGINADIGFTSEKTDFKSVLGLVPAVYMKNFETITTTGSFTLAGYVKGTYNDTQMPNAGVSLAIDNAMFKYPELPKSANNINIKARAFYDGAAFDRTTLDVDKLQFEIAGNPFYAELHVKTPASDMQVAANLFGSIDFNSLTDIVPLDDTTLNGLLECDIALAGRMSAIEKQRYEDFDAKGVLKMNDIYFKSSNFPKVVKIAKTRLNITPKRVELANFDAVIGNSDLSLNGALENYIPFIFKGAAARGELNLKSDTIDLNEFMSSKETVKKPKEEEPSPLSAIEVPKNIDFGVKLSVARLLFDKLNITETTGAILVKDGKLRMQNLDMNLLAGSVRLSGEYNTQDIKAPSVNFDANLKQIDAASAIASFGILQKILPQPQNYAGKVSANLTLSGVLDERLSPVLNTVYSKGRLQTHNLRIQNSELFGAMANLLKNESWRSPALNNITVNYIIKDGRLIIEPIRMNIAQAALELTGAQGLDKSLDYKANAAVPVSTVGPGATEVLSKVPGGSKIREIKVTGLITGTPAKPAVTLSVADMAANVAETVKETVKEQVKETVKENVEKQAASILDAFKKNNK